MCELCRHAVAHASGIRHALAHTRPSHHLCKRRVRRAQQRAEREQQLGRRRELYLAKGAPLFGGQVFVPDDLDVIELG